MQSIKRDQLFKDVYDGIIPKRVPNYATLPLEYCIQYGSLDLGESQWTLEGVLDPVVELCEKIGFDLLPLGTPRYPSYFSILGSKTFSMGGSGFMQHPEVCGMEAKDYDIFIENPRDYILSEVYPKLFTNWNPDPMLNAITFAEAVLAYQEIQNKHISMLGKLRSVFEFYVPPQGSVSGVTVPFDYIADFLRGFTGILNDVKRCPDKVAMACESVLSYLLHKGLPDNPSRYGQTFIPLHMATYLREKEFRELYYPTFYKLVYHLADNGQPAFIFCEGNWMRYLDYLYDMPVGTRFCFEYGDPQIIKDKLGAKHILSGLYPMTYLRTADEKMCVDKAKELIDIMAPGGNYIFNFDKNPFTLKDIRLENYIAVVDYIRNHTYYSNSGEPSIKREFYDIGHKNEKLPTFGFESKYYQTKFSDNKEKMFIPEKYEKTAKKVIEKHEDFVLKFLNRIL